MAISWTLNSGVLTISGTGAMDNYTTSSHAPWYENRNSITSVIIENGVTSIGDRAFYIYVNLTNVTIPDSVTSIGENAFWICNNLTNITIPDNVISIGNDAFGGCASLTSMTIPSSVTSIGTSIFYNCINLTMINVDTNNASYSSVGGVLFNKEKTILLQYPNGNPRTDYTIPDSVMRIDQYAFYGCSNLTSVTIPDSVINIGTRTFGHCSKQTTINVSTNNTVYSSVDGVLFNKEKTTLILYPIGNSRTNYTIPNSVTKINTYAFAYCANLTSVTIPDSVTIIDSFTFYDCSNLKDVYYIGNETEWNSITIYANNESLTNATIHYNYSPIIANGYCGGESDGTNLSWTLDNNGVLTISGTGAMKDYDGSNPTPWNGNENIITSIIIEDGVTTIGSYAFTETNLTSITFPNSITDIGYVAFSDCPSLTNVTIPNSITNIDYFAFSDCVALTNISVAEDNQYYASDTNGCLYNKNKTELIQYPIGNTRISFSIPNTVTDILSLAFSSCISLTNITIPNSVINIENETFINCTALTDVYYSGNETDWNAITIGTQNDSLLNATIHYDSSSTNSTYLVTKAELTSIANAIRTKVGTTSKYTWPSQMINAIREIPQLDTTDATATPTDILDGKTAYVNGEKITGTASGGGSATEPYCEYTFDTNGNVTAAKLYGFTSIPSGMFRSYIYLENIDISESPNITKIGDFAFYSCTKLILDSLPSGLTSIGQSAFYNCLAVTFTSLPSGLTSIGQSAFYGCKNIELTSLPIGITDIPQQAFDGCTKCAFSYLPSTIKSFGDYAFRKCLGITEIEIAASLKDAFEPSNIFGNNTNLKKVWLRNTCTTIQATSASKAPFAGCSTSLAIYAEPSEKLSGWGTYYNRTGSSGGTEVAVTFNQTTRPW